MIYTSFSLDGSWEMAYSYEAYTGKDVPHFDGFEIKNAVPGYWEDMEREFADAPFCENLRVNPSYGNQRYPLSTTAPDMALPNYVGNFFYRRKITGDFPAADGSIFFEGVQNTVSVWINETYIGTHRGYSTPFYMDIPQGIFADGENTIVLSVSNLPMAGYGGRIITGLTNRAANEYTGGITGDVELRFFTSALRDARILISDDCKTAFVKTDMQCQARFTWELSDGETVIKEGTGTGDFAFGTEELELWSPENPKLYTLKITCGKGDMTLPLGVRKLLPDGSKLKLNSVPYYLRGACEHCYFPDSVHPNHSIEFYRKIITTLKDVGFNFIRFHTYIPPEEYMQAADEVGMLLHVECPNNTTTDEWKEIVKFCSRHPSVVIYCCGNELTMDEPFIEYLENCAHIVHSCTDALFSPMSALRGVEYCCFDEGCIGKTEDKPFTHNPTRLGRLSAFSDVYSSFANELLSYNSLKADPSEIDSWENVYNKPRLSHEICIDGTYTDLSLTERYKKSRIGKTEMFTSIKNHLAEKGVLAKAHTYFENSCKWQSLVRKYCFEATRRCNNLAGFDFLGPIDTHWHTFGYDVGMMNEFYELKPGETVENIRMYNSATVLLNDLGLKTNYQCGENLKGNILVSHFGKSDICCGKLTICLFASGERIYKDAVTVNNVKNGVVSTVYAMDIELMQTDAPKELKLWVNLEADGVLAENCWELYLFPKALKTDANGLIVSEGMSDVELRELLLQGRDVVLFGSEPFETIETSFRIALAGRCAGNLATVIHNHPAIEGIPHKGFCSWQFASLMEGGQAVVFDDGIPFEPVVEVVSTHKHVIRQSSLFEFRALNGRLLVCSMNFKTDDPAAEWLKSKLISYAKSSDFVPCNYLDKQLLDKLLYSKIRNAESNTNFAFNPNDKAMQKVEE